MTANLIHSRDTYYIVRDILKCLDSRVANHGERTAFILYNMLFTFCIFISDKCVL